MTEWLYPVNDRSPNWSDDPDEPDLLSFMQQRQKGRTHKWTLPYRLRDLAPGDVIWVRGTSPISAVAAMGEVLSGARPAPLWEGRWLFDVSFDNSQTRGLSRSPLAIDLESSARTVRRLKDKERRQIRRGVTTSHDAETRGKTWRLGRLANRQGQSAFRQSLMLAYGSRCAITDCAVEATLQAAHIRPFDGPASNKTSNGLLLRGDVHNLFDRGLLWVSAGLRVGVSRELDESEYAAFRGRKLRTPRNAEFQPDSAALAEHRVKVAGQKA
jgi:hypothetical protein